MVIGKFIEKQGTVIALYLESLQCNHPRYVLTAKWWTMMGVV